MTRQVTKQMRASFGYPSLSGTKKQRVFILKKVIK